ncbi:hypothetical protein E2562_033096 [Oryza meyeriana var. granulata]|uniref:Uncharacterized protein n=1 Tax=Oryza meyeriana var. granulata TaxID=110450 RepID=A0A6G1ES01_9ORYZ|nr:hypothetical protein E2562_033096 [Oryza meyeriana var. granulata]
MPTACECRVAITSSSRLTWEGQTGSGVAIGPQGRVSSNQGTLVGQLGKVGGGALKPGGA